MSAKRKLDIDEQKTRVIQAVQGLGLFSKDEIYREYYDMTDSEIEKIKKELEKDMEDEMKKQEAMMPPAAPGAPPAGAPPAGAPPGGKAGYGEAGGQEPAENVPPTVESKIESLEALKNIVLEEKKEVISRIIKKQQQKHKLL